MTGTDAVNMLDRLLKLELAALTLATFAGHDDECINNKISDSITPGSCSCGYSKAQRDFFKALCGK